MGALLAAAPAPVAAEEEVVEAVGAVEVVVEGAAVESFQEV